MEGTTQPFVVWTDHKNLAYLQPAKRLNARQARWALFFTRFNFTLNNRPKTGISKQMPCPINSLPQKEGPFLPPFLLLPALQAPLPGRLRKSFGKHRRQSLTQEEGLSICCLFLSLSDPRFCIGPIQLASLATLEFSKPLSSSTGTFGGHLQPEMCGSMSLPEKNLLINHLRDSFILCPPPLDPGLTSP